MATPISVASLEHDPLALLIVRLAAFARSRL